MDWKQMRKAWSSAGLVLRSVTGLETYEENEEEPHVGMLLQVYRADTEASETTADVTYELIDPMHLELGVTAKHDVDFAYTPVTSFGHPPVTDLKKDSHHGWWEWWLRDPWGDEEQDHFSQYRMKNSAFAGGSHGEVWRGRRRCRGSKKTQDFCNENLILKRLKVENGYKVLEAGLREVYFGSWLEQQQKKVASMYTRYVDHFFRERPGKEIELWIVFRDAGPSLRSYLYTGVSVGDYVVYRNSDLWTQLRLSIARKNSTTDKAVVPLSEPRNYTAEADESARLEAASLVGRRLMKKVLQQIVEAAAFLHSNGIIHRDIKPSNILCTSNLDPEDLVPRDGTAPTVHCVLADFSSGWNNYTNENLYTKGPSRAEQTDEYAPPETVFGNVYGSKASLIPQFDAWSIGIVALELLLGTPNVFSVDQRTRAILSIKMQKQGATEEEIQRALYLAALSQFCIYNPAIENSQNWPLRDGDPLQKTSMVKQSCTLNDFHRALRARDPLGLGFDSSTDTLLRFIWQLLSWNPLERMTPAEALSHPYLMSADSTKTTYSHPGSHNAIESQMLDPRMDFNLSAVREFTCPKCGRTFEDWGSCQQHAVARKHAKFCSYDKSSLPSCLNAHSLLPAHSFSGYCDIQGRRRVIEDFHSIHLLPSWKFYGIFDGHSGNLASKFAASSLYEELAMRLVDIDEEAATQPEWKKRVKQEVSDAVALIHTRFLEVVSMVPNGMDQSGTTATALLWTPNTVSIVSLGDSRAVMPCWKNEGAQMSPIQLTSDHVASDPKEKALVEARGGRVWTINGVDRVEGKVVVTRSIGDLNLATFLGQDPDIVSMSRQEVKDRCGKPADASLPCFVILASDGLWDMISNQEAVDMVVEVLAHKPWRENGGLQEAAERLTLEAYVRGSTDNIGVCVVAIEQD
jgi:serine/threonine protein phosphatase PrpC